MLNEYKFDQAEDLEIIHKQRIEIEASCHFLPFSGNIHRSAFPSYLHNSGVFLPNIGDYPENLTNHLTLFHFINLALLFNKEDSSWTAHCATPFTKSSFLTSVQEADFQTIPAITHEKTGTTTIVGSSVSPSDRKAGRLS
ncbi:hypothetical protein RIR_jg20085.t1 [Rhizophagus irregularis DAOM 181602=DAOM 197198]|nr:hypothetical protein RIR_jg20085.t1 [Rhizophagus irregularis DAOM 181602=DAOM 197198]